jgi:hypothetical protein
MHRQLSCWRPRDVANFVFRAPVSFQMVINKIIVINARSDVNVHQVCHILPGGSLHLHMSRVAHVSSVSDFVNNEPQVLMCSYKPWVMCLL